MDITSLPDEMLTNVLKYTDFETVRRIRKMNKRIDKLAKKADIGIKVPFNKMTCKDDTIYGEHREETEFSVNHHVFSRKHGFLYTRLNPVNIQDLASALAKVEVSQILFENCVIQDELIEVMKQNKKSLRSVNAIRMLSSSFKISKDNAKCWINKIFPNIKSLCLEKCYNVPVQYMYTTEVFGHRKWKELVIKRLSFTEAANKLDVDFITNVAPRCQIFKTNYNHDFTVTEALNLVKKCQENSKLNHVLHLGAVEYQIIPKEVERLFDDNRLGVTKMQWSERSITREFEVTCEHAGQSISLTMGFYKIQIIQ